MKIINQSNSILNISIQPLEELELVGRVCYKSEHKIDKDTAIDFVKKIIKNKHESILEFGDGLTVKFITNRGVTHELVRHRLFSFAQESTRYVKYNNIEFIKPVWCSDKLLGQHTIEWNNNIGIRKEGEIELSNSENIWFWSMARIEKDYKDLLNCGWRTEEAREVLTNSLKTEIVVKGNFRQWRHVFKLRTSKKAHPQIRELMQTLLNNLKMAIPVIFDDI